MAQQLKSRYDVIINGGGIVGFTLLNLLKNSRYLKDCRVLLIEQAKRPSDLNQPARQIVETTSNSISEDSKNELAFSNRVSSITRKSQLILERLGIWPNVKQFSKDVRNIRVWNYDYSDSIMFDQNISNDVMFSVIENNRLSLALLNQLSNRHSGGGDVILWNNSLQHFHKSDEGIEVSIKNLETNEENIVTSSLLIGCDGFKSKVRELSQMKYSEIDLNKTAVVGTVRVDNSISPSNEIAYQRFSSEKDTVAALLPLHEQYSSFVISAPNEYAKHLVNCDNETFIDEFNDLLSRKESPNSNLLNSIHLLTRKLNQNISNISMNSQFGNMEMSTNFGYIEPPKLLSIAGSRAMFPLIFGTTSPRMIAVPQGQEFYQIALLGDSSHRVHPLAGQGLNLGIQDAGELVDQLEVKAKCGERVFDVKDNSILSKALKAYECKRQSSIIPMSAAILLMPTLFKVAPSWTLSSFNSMNKLKSTLVKFADGI